MFPNVFGAKWRATPLASWRIWFGIHRSCYAIGTVTVDALLYARAKEFEKCRISDSNDSRSHTVSAISDRKNSRIIPLIL